jgi:hypothetical protein
MSNGSAMDNDAIVIRKRPAPAFPRLRRRAGRRERGRRLSIIAGFSVVGLLFWLKISLGFGHGSTVT